MNFGSAASLLKAALCCIVAVSSSAAHLPSAAVGITFDSNNIYNWSIWQFDITTSPPAHALLANIPGLYSVYASIVPFHDASFSTYVFYATDVGNNAYLGVLNLSSLQLSVRPVPQISDWVEMACDSTTCYSIDVDHNQVVAVDIASAGTSIVTTYSDAFYGVIDDAYAFNVKARELYAVLDHKEYGQVLTVLPLDGKSPVRVLPGANVSSGPLCYDPTTSTLLALDHPDGGIVKIDVAGRGASKVILKDGIGITSFGTVDCNNGLVSVLQVMFEQTPTQYDIIIRDVSAAGAVVYNGSAAGNNMIGLKLRFPQAEPRRIMSLDV